MKREHWCSLTYPRRRITVFQSFRSSCRDFRLCHSSITKSAILFSYRSVAAQIREKQARYVIPGLSHEDAAEISKQRGVIMMNNLGKSNDGQSKDVKKKKPNKAQSNLKDASSTEGKVLQLA